MNRLIKAIQAGKFALGTIFERQNMERNKAAHMSPVLQLRTNRLHRVSVQRRPPNRLNLS